MEAKEAQAPMPFSVGLAPFVIVNVYIMHVNYRNCWKVLNIIHDPYQSYEVIYMQLIIM